VSYRSSITEYDLFGSQNEGRLRQSLPWHRKKGGRKEGGNLGLKANERMKNMLLERGTLKSTSRRSKEKPPKRNDVLKRSRMAWPPRGGAVPMVRGEKPDFSEETQKKKGEGSTRRNSGLGPPRKAPYSG